MDSIVYRVICIEYNFERSKDWWVRPEKVVRNDFDKTVWDFPIQVDKNLHHNQLEIVLINYKEQTSLLIDITVLKDENIQDKKLEKIGKYQSLKIELEQLWNVKIMVISVVVGALGAIANRLLSWLAHIPGMIKEVKMQKDTLLGMAHVFLCVLVESQV